MMSFMRQESESDVTSANGSDGKDVSGRAGESQDDYLLPSNNVKNVKRNTMVLGVLFVAGILSLVFMIKRVNPSTANAAISDDALQIESAVANLSGIQTEMGSKLSEVVSKISSLSDIEQVEVDQLQKNPFRHSSVIDFDMIELDMGDKSQSSFGQRVTKKVELRLWTIMSSGKGRSCMINNEILYEGDSISGFRVKRIGDDFVDLSSNGASVLLRMSK
jgi:preprotein translocase subunit SecG